MLDRTLIDEVGKVLDIWGKMLFLSGPRQVGKTTFAKQVLEQRGGGTYFNWDSVTDRRLLARDPYFFAKVPRSRGGSAVVVFDEIHKYPRWKSYLKGAYDGFADEFRFLVTGSGRLDLFQRGGDSLLGRYVALPLFPLTLGELAGRRPRWKELGASLLDPPLPPRTARRRLVRLLLHGGFPEPYSKEDPDFTRVWSTSRTELLVREDIRDATNIRQIAQVEMLAHLVEPRVGSPFSLNSLREDLGVAFDTVRDWVEVLARFFYLFRIQPYSKSLTRALRKEAKAYLYDWSACEHPAARFENLVALHLLKAVRTWTALGETKADLFYVRDRDGREVDFLLTIDRKPALLVECKTSERELAPSLLAYQERLDVPIAVQVVLETGRDAEWRRGKRLQRLMSAEAFLSLLP